MPWVGGNKCSLKITSFENQRFLLSFLGRPSTLLVHFVRCALAGGSVIIRWRADHQRTSSEEAAKKVRMK